MITGFAVDLGGTKMAAARIEDGRITQREQVPTDRRAGLEGQIAQMGRLLESLGYQSGQRLGVAVAGRVDADGCWRAVNADTLSAIGGAPLLQQLRETFGQSVTAMNDAAAASLAEAALGAGQGSAHFAYLTVSTGVGGGIVLDGKLLQSRNGLAGHLGFMSSPFGREICGSGRRGTVESVASGRAIALAAGTPDARAAFELGTESGHAAIDRSIAAVARLCGDLTAIFGLDRIALGGSVGLAEGYLSGVTARIQEEPELFRVPVVRAMLGHDSALLGALLSKGELP